MGRPKGGKNNKYDYDFKLMVVKEHLEDHISNNKLAKKYGIAYSVIERWSNLYNDGLLESGKKRNGNKFAALYTSKSLTNEKRLELENLMLRVENERLKKGYLVKGVGANKEYVSILDMNTKSSKH